MRCDLRPLFADARLLAREPRSRSLLLFVFCLDWPFAFIFLIALQSYFTPQRLAGRPVPGLALAAFAAGKLAMQDHGGRITDRLGAHRALSLGFICIAMALCLLELAPSLPLLVLAACVVYGAGTALAWPALLAQAHALPPVSRGALTASMTLATGAGVAAALALGLVLPSNVPFRIAPLLALTAVGLALALSLASERRSPFVPIEVESHSLRLSSVLAQPACLGLGAVVLLLSIAASMLLASFRATGRDLMGVSLQRETLLLLPAGACFGIGVVLAGLLGRVSRRATLMTGLVFAGASFLTLSQVAGLERQVALLGAGCIGLGLAVPTMTALSLDLARAAPGLLFGYLFALEGAGHMAGPLLTAMLADVRVSLALTGAVLIIAALVVLQMREAQEGAMELAGNAG